MLIRKRVDVHAVTIYPYPLRVYDVRVAKTLRIQGLRCGHCVASITSAVAPLPGVTGVNVDLENGVVTVEGTPDERAVAVAIEDCGFDVDAPCTESA